MYAPPEQFAGAPATPASDVYAATATFYECLTGGPPFAGRTAEVLMYQHMAEPVKLEPVPEELRSLIEIGMAKDPARRPTDGTSFVAALQAAAVGAYGPHWEQRGRSHLGEAALLLAALWPSGGPPGVGAMTVEKVPLYRRMTASKVAVVGSAAVFIAAAGTALAATSFREPGSGKTHPAVAAVQQVTLSPSPSAASSQSPSPTPSPKKSPTVAPTVAPQATFSPAAAVAEAFSVDQAVTHAVCNTLADALAVSVCISVADAAADLYVSEAIADADAAALRLERVSASRRVRRHLSGMPADVS